MKVHDSCAIYMHFSIIVYDCHLILGVCLLYNVESCHIFFLCFLGTSIFNEDHNFKTPDKVSVRDFKHKGRLVCNM